MRTFISGCLLFAVLVLVAAVNGCGGHSSPATDPALEAVRKSTFIVSSKQPEGLFFTRESSGESLSGYDMTGLARCVKSHDIFYFRTPDGSLRWQIEVWPQGEAPKAASRGGTNYYDAVLTCGDLVITSTRQLTGTDEFLNLRMTGPSLPKEESWFYLITGNANSYWYDSIRRFMVSTPYPVYERWLLTETFMPFVEYGAYPWNR